MYIKMACPFKKWMYAVALCHVSLFFIALLQFFFNSRSTVVAFSTS